MLYVTIAELAAHLDKYIEMAKDEDIFIRENGQYLAMLTAPDFGKGDKQYGPFKTTEEMMKSLETEDIS
ncbi:MAG: hypothetical protein HFF72_00645 [Oscillospiraceae bacterium]|jgi:hypothetical protein|nr:hypothetical protein [uncultured Oscillibacter sp.]MCI8655929.1 hypothetical protein [Oscillospiraceae bacterium]